MDFVQAILIGPGYKASQDVQASQVHLDGWWQRVEQQELLLGLESG